MEKKISAREKDMPIPAEKDASCKLEEGAYEISFCCGARVFYQPAGAFIFSVCPQCGIAYFPSLIKVRLDVP